jgi:hypothetical protein
MALEDFYGRCERFGPRTQPADLLPKRLQAQIQHRDTFFLSACH